MVSIPTGCFVSKSVVMSSRTNGRQISILINFLIELINGGRRNEEDDSDLNGFV